MNSPIQLLQPWSTFVMKTELSPEVLEKMLRISDEIVENKESESQNLDAGQIKDQFYIDLKILEQEEILEFFTEMCRNFVIQAYCQSQPFNTKNILKEKWLTRLTEIWINSQKDNEYFPIHHHSYSISAVMYLKIPEYLPSRHSRNYGAFPIRPMVYEDDGGISFSSNCSRNTMWAIPTMAIQPQVGDFFIFPATQEHQVYPFRTPNGKGERRSVSFNAKFTNKTIQEEMHNKLQQNEISRTEGIENE